jgi:hypothetical protein
MDDNQSTNPYQNPQPAPDPAQAPQPGYGYGPQGTPQQPQPAATPPQPQMPPSRPDQAQYGYEQPRSQQQPSVPGPAAQQPPQPQPSGQQRPPLRIDHALLAELGLGGLPEQEKKDLEKHIYETLEMRVGMRLADQMTNEQLDEFETYFNARDDAGAFRWLETNFPNYKDIVAEEFEKLKGEVAHNAPHILAASQQAVSGEQSPPPQQP